jgi:hypothetical protein
MMADCLLVASRVVTRGALSVLSFARWSSGFCFRKSKISVDRMGHHTAGCVYGRCGPLDIAISHIKTPRTDFDIARPFGPDPELPRERMRAGLFLIAKQWPHIAGPAGPEFQTVTRHRT